MIGGCTSLGSGCSSKNNTKSLLHCSVNNTGWILSVNEKRGHLNTLDKKNHCRLCRDVLNVQIVKRELNRVCLGCEKETIHEN